MARRGGQVDVTGSVPIQGAGGAGTAGGGAGGAGGFTDGTLVLDGEAGGLPPGLPPELIPDPNAGAPPGGDGELLTQAVVVATGGESRAVLCPTTGACYPGHGGGGGYSAAGEDGAAATGGAVTTGTGGEPFGTPYLANPETGAPLTVGGTGGAGGGGNSDGIGDGSITPGTGGGGAGGYLQLSVGGALLIGPTARLLADGGNAYQAPAYGGNGGGGAGGAIKIQCNGLVTFETGPAGTAPIVRAQAGVANQSPTADFDANNIVDYAGNGLHSAGGAGAPGRIRIESLAGFAAIAATNCGTSIILYTQPYNIPLTGVCPVATIGYFEEGGQIRSEARTLPFPVAREGGVQDLSAVLAAPELAFQSSLLPANTRVKVLLEGARESLDVPGTPGEFYGLVSDPSLIGGAEYLRLRFLLFADANGGNVPAIDFVNIPIDFAGP